LGEIVKLRRMERGWEGESRGHVVSRPGMWSLSRAIEWSSASQMALGAVVFGEGLGGGVGGGIPAVVVVVGQISGGHVLLK